MCDFGLSVRTDKGEPCYGGTKMYMSPLRRKLADKHIKLPLHLVFRSDAFSFGLSILEMGNLLSLKDIKLNNNKTLLN